MSEFTSSQPIPKWQTNLQKQRLEAAIMQRLAVLNKSDAFSNSAFTLSETTPMPSISGYVGREVDSLFVLSLLLVGYIVTKFWGNAVLLSQ
jgi:hypothetical protein